MTSRPLSADLSVGGPPEDSDLSLVDLPELTEANHQILEALIVALQKSNRPVLLLNQRPLIDEVEGLAHVRSGLNGVVTRDMLSSCLETLLNLEPVDPDYNWETALSLLRPFAQATIEVLETTANAKARLLGFLTGRVIPPNGLLASCMTLEGEIEGLAMVVFATDQARRIAAGMAFCSETDISDEDLSDAVKEIINQVSGRVRTMAWPDNYKFNIDLPHFFRLESNEEPVYSAAGWITILLECFGQVCSVSIKASKTNNPVKEISLPASS